MVNKKYKNKVESQEKIDAIRNEEIVQDRIVGLTIKELSEKYKKDRQTITNVLEPNLERIARDREKLLSERAERIQNAVDADTENMIELMGRTTKLMLNMIDRTEKAMKKITDDAIAKNPEIAFKGLWSATKACEKVRSTLLAQQKQNND